MDKNPAIPAVSFWTLMNVVFVARGSSKDSHLLKMFHMCTCTLKVWKTSLHPNKSIHMDQGLKKSIRLWHKSQFNVTNHSSRLLFFERKKNVPWIMNPASCAATVARMQNAIGITCAKGRDPPSYTAGTWSHDGFQSIHLIILLVPNCRWKFRINKKETTTPSCKWSPWTPKIASLCPSMFRFTISKQKSRLKKYPPPSSEVYLQPLVEKK